MEYYAPPLVTPGLSRGPPGHARSSGIPRIAVGPGTSPG